MRRREFITVVGGGVVAWRLTGARKSSPSASGFWLVAAASRFVACIVAIAGATAKKL
jgi:hypothetical protein